MPSLDGRYAVVRRVQTKTRTSNLLSYSKRWQRVVECFFTRHLNMDGHAMHAIRPCSPARSTRIAATRLVVSSVYQNCSRKQGLNGAGSFPTTAKQLSSRTIQSPGTGPTALGSRPRAAAQPRSRAAPARSRSARPGRAPTAGGYRPPPPPPTWLGGHGPPRQVLHLDNSAAVQVRWPTPARQEAAPTRDSGGDSGTSPFYNRVGACVCS